MPRAVGRDAVGVKVIVGVSVMVGVMVIVGVSVAVAVLVAVAVAVDVGVKVLVGIELMIDVLVAPIPKDSCVSRSTAMLPIPMSRDSLGFVLGEEFNSRMLLAR